MGKKTVIERLEEIRDSIPMYFGKIPPLIENEEWTKINDLINELNNG